VPSRGWVYPNRTLFLTLATMVVLVSAWIWKSGVAMPRDGFAACAAVTFALSVALFVRLEAWREYRAQVVNIVHSRHGLVPVAETPIWRHTRRTAVNLSEAGLLWDSWNLPQLCLVWSWPRVQAIILNPPGTSWEPFDPRRERPLQRYLRYDPALTVPPAGNPQGSASR